jgi:hypothetical protein
MDIQEVRKKIFERDGNKCYKCESTKKLCMDHVNPKSKFHYHGIDNILTLCWDCNSSKYIKILPQNEFEEIKQYLNEVNQRFTIDEATEMGIIIKEFYNTPKKNKERRRRENWRDLALPDRDGKLRTYTIYRMRD